MTTASACRSDRPCVLFAQLLAEPQEQGAPKIDELLDVADRNGFEVQAVFLSREPNDLDPGKLLRFLGSLDHGTLLVGEHGRAAIDQHGLLPKLGDAGWVIVDLCLSAVRPGHNLGWADQINEWKQGLLAHYQSLSPSDLLNLLHEKLRVALSHRYTFRAYERCGGPLCSGCGVMVDLELAVMKTVVGHDAYEAIRAELDEWFRDPAGAEERLTSTPCKSCGEVPEDLLHFVECGGGGAA